MSHISSSPLIFRKKRHESSVILNYFRAYLTCFSKMYTIILKVFSDFCQNHPWEYGIFDRHFRFSLKYQAAFFDFFHPDNLIIHKIISQKNHTYTVTWTTRIISVFYARRTGFSSLTSAQSCIYIFFLYIYFNSFYRKIQCVSAFLSQNSMRFILWNKIKGIEFWTN